MEQYKSVWRPLTAFDPATYNPREITDIALEALGESLEEFGLVQPLIVNLRSEDKGWPPGSRPKASISR